MSNENKYKSLNVPKNNGVLGANINAVDFCIRFIVGYEIIYNIFKGRLDFSIGNNPEDSFWIELNELSTKEELIGGLKDIIRRLES
jgi:hypothetical protein